MLPRKNRDRGCKKSNKSFLLAILILLPVLIIIQLLGSLQYATEELQNPALPSNMNTTATSPNGTTEINYSRLDKGAFVHLSKTGGSTVSLLLQNGCHSFMKKPCRGRENIPNETIASLKVKHYYHIPDFHKLPKDKTHPFYILTLRDPYQRSRSSFVYGHPANNVAIHQAHNPWKKYNTSVANFTYCWDTLEHFVQNLGDLSNNKYEVRNYNYTYPPPPKDLNHQRNCQDFARAALHHKVDMLPHLYYSLDHIAELMEPHLIGEKDSMTVIFVTRQEHLREDWIEINAMLGQNDAFFPTKKTRDISETELPVRNELSQDGRVTLCRALRGEYQEYLRFLKASVNLKQEDVDDSLALARKNCGSELEFL